MNIRYIQDIKEIRDIRHIKDIKGISKIPWHLSLCINASISTLYLFWNNLNMKNIGTKSVNMNDIMVYLAMFSTTIDQILCFWFLIRWKWVIILLVFGTLWNLELLGFPRTPPYNSLVRSEVSDLRVLGPWCLISWGKK